jgi:hypothetical protein
MIETLTKEDSWKFIFLAANQDAIRAGNSIGIQSSNSMTYAATSDGASRAFATVSSNMSKYRSSKSVMYSSLAEDATMDTALFAQDLNFSDSQRDEQKKEGA